jgi:hypothetical protein
MHPKHYAWDCINHRWFYAQEPTRDVSGPILRGVEEQVHTKSSIEVTKCTSSNILVWFGRDAPEKSVAGLRESLISSPFENLQKD